jgi:hypothetical protein
LNSNFLATPFRRVSLQLKQFHFFSGPRELFSFSFYQEREPFCVISLISLAIIDESACLFGLSFRVSR